MNAVVRKQFGDLSYRLGVDIGSTTIKLLLLGERDNDILFRTYRRHHADIRAGLLAACTELKQLIPRAKVQIAITGSGGLSLARWLGLPFVQEVIAETQAVARFIPQTDVIIELGGEDAKITYLKLVPEQRMNGSCAGGTGAFLDQMAVLLKTDTPGLNELAKNYRSLYPIASRCGVFAKTDLQPLINDGAERSDLAASVLQAVVNQTIAGLACGRPIRGHIAFLGGPLYYLSELRRAFERSLPGSQNQFICPEDAHLYVALGAALLAGEEASEFVSIEALIERLQNNGVEEHEITRMRPLFASAEEKAEFDLRHSAGKVNFASISETKGPCYLGIDAGSTTTKAIVLDEEERPIFSSYESNRGDPVKSAIKILKQLYAALPSGAHIASACVTGYGESLIQTALSIPHGEIETMAHYKAAERFLPGVSYILDIGGQDMKCLHVRDGVIDSISVNEACSSGCGSFIQTFAETMNLSVEDFAAAAIESQKPVDLGTRCTVFMNSRVKQAQREGAAVGDISAGLSYSVVRNALYKVMKIKRPEDLGPKVMVQGGTFMNDAILRAFELTVEREVLRLDIAGLMGAYGAALIARERRAEKAESVLISSEALNNFSVKTSLSRCNACTNSCQLTISTFGNGERHVSGNRCERGVGGLKNAEKLPNLMAWKAKRIFAPESLKAETAPRGVIGIPRALNIYENYVFWHRFLTELGFSVKLSGTSNHSLYEKGMESIPSESVCYPAKLTHGHIEDLIQSGVQRIFYPSVAYEEQEYEGSNNHFNCPIVCSYPETIRYNIDALREGKPEFIHPFIDLKDRKGTERILFETFGRFGASYGEVVEATRKAYAADDELRREIRQKGEESLARLKAEGRSGIVLAGRPYHCDPEINHGIPELINSLGLAVLTEDSIAHLGDLERPLRVVDQWAYHSRLYQAAACVAAEANLEMVQLNSFGCGLDAVTTDQVQEILEAKGKIYTLLKIDEVANLGAARIRLRSLKVSMDERRKQNQDKRLRGTHVRKRVEFTAEMKQTHTILSPQMAPIQFTLLEAALRRSGYKLKVLEKVSPADIECGLKFVNNDACYPCILTTGQLINAFISGVADPACTTVAITQTGGGCRATNYVAFIRKALVDAGYPQVPVLALSASGIEHNSGFKFTPRLLHHVVQAISFGDMLQTMLLRTRPYERDKGSANRLLHRWYSIWSEFMLSGGKSPTLGGQYSFHKLIDAAVSEFDRLPLLNIARKVRVGVVGEILVKFHPDANNNVISVIEEEGCEASMPGLLDFFLYCFHSAAWDASYYRKSAGREMLFKTIIRSIELYRSHINRAFRRSGKFAPTEKIDDLAKRAETYLSLGNSTGEGWFLTAEMLELIAAGAPNIICAQPFACLPNHVTGKGMIKELRRRNPEANIVAVDYDPGASEVNQLNRIKLMISAALRREDGATVYNELPSLRATRPVWVKP